jgi:hypothetical protein
MGSSRSLPRDHEQLSKKGNRVQILDGVASTSVAYIPRARPGGWRDFSCQPSLRDRLCDTWSASSRSRRYADC